MLKALLLSLVSLLLVSTLFSQTKISGYLQYQYRVEFKDQRTETFTPGTINLKFSGSLSGCVVNPWEIYSFKFHFNNKQSTKPSPKTTHTLKPNAITSLTLKNPSKPFLNSFIYLAILNKL